MMQLEALHGKPWVEKIPGVEQFPYSPPPFFFLASSTAYLLDSDILYREKLAGSRVCVQFALLVLSHSAQQRSILPSGVLCAPWIIFKITPVWVTVPADLRRQSASKAKCLLQHGVCALKMERIIDGDCDQLSKMWWDLITYLLRCFHSEEVQGNIWLNNLDKFTHRKPQQAAMR